MPGFLRHGLSIIELCFAKQTEKGEILVTYKKNCFNIQTKGPVLCHWLQTTQMTHKWQYSATFLRSDLKKINLLGKCVYNGSKPMNAKVFSGGLSANCLCKNVPSTLFGIKLLAQGMCQNQQSPYVL